jgi:hypothetical protein
MTESAERNRDHWDQFLIRVSKALSAGEPTNGLIAEIDSALEAAKREGLEQRDLDWGHAIRNSIENVDMNAPCEYPTHADMPVAGEVLERNYSALRDHWKREGMETISRIAEDIAQIHNNWDLPEGVYDKLVKAHDELLALIARPPEGEGCRHEWHYAPNVRLCNRCGTTQSGHFEAKGEAP